MNNRFKISAIGALFLCMLASNTTMAKSNPANNLSNAELQTAYKRLILSAGTQQSNTRNKFSSRSNVIIKTAKQQLRKKYRWGGASPRRGFDCSGLVQYAYKSAKIKLPRTAAQQYKHTKRVSLSHLKAGDLIFFHTRRRSHTRINHVGIYMGGGNFIHAPRRGKRVSISKLDHYWKRRAIGAGRI